MSTNFKKKIEMANTFNNTLLRQKFNAVANEYLDAFLKMFDIDESYGYWVAGEVGGQYAYGDDLFVDFSDMMYVVDNNVPKSTFDEWLGYCVFALEFGQTTPNLKSWVKGCPRLSKREIERLQKLRRDFEVTCKRYKNKY